MLDYNVRRMQVPIDNSLRVEIFNSLGQRGEIKLDHFVRQDSKSVNNALKRNTCIRIDVPLTYS